MREKLFFDGLAWPAARIVGRERVPGRYASGFFGGDQPNEAETFVVDTSGNGRSYQVQYAEGWWRDLAELRTTNERQILSFLARRGDLFGELKPGQPIRMVYWDELIARLRQAAHAWEPVTNPMSISALRPGDPYEIAKSFLVGLDPRWTTQLDVTFDGLIPVLRAKVLAAYVTAAAAVSLRQRRPMRRCLYCASWFTIHHTGAEFCSPSCRASAHNGRTSPHVFRSQDLHPEGDAPLAGPLEHPRTARDADRESAQLQDTEGRKRLRRKDARRGRAPRRRRPAKA
jgi:hypothetical protein